jgi:hypothetical protein
VRCCENSGDRTGSTRGGAGDGVTRGLSERRALTVVQMSAAALRYVPRPDPDPSLRDRIVALAHRHRRYGAGMIYLKLRQEGRRINHKRVDRLYAEARLQVRRRRRKNVPLAEPAAARPAAGPQRSVVGGLRVRSHRRRARVEVSDDLEFDRLPTIDGVRTFTLLKSTVTLPAPSHS